MLKTDSKCPVMRLLCFLLLTLPSTVASLARTAQRSPAASTRLSGAIRPASPAGVLGRRSYRARAGRFRTSPPLCVRMMCGACGGESPGGGAERHHSGSAEEDDCLGASIRELGELAQPLVRGGDLGAAPFAPGSLPELPGGPVLILGAGWVGSRLAARLSQERCARVAVTNRPDWRSRQKEAYFAPVPLNPPPVSRHAFDIDAPETWDALPEPETLGAAVLTFAATADQLRPFWERYLRKVPRTVAYSSTAVYRVDVPGQEVDETTPLRPTARAAADAFLLQRGATVLTISGIFGEAQDARGVCTCFAAYASAGGALNGQKSVNMVHVDDIIAATAHALAAEARALESKSGGDVGGDVDPHSAVLRRTPPYSAVFTALVPLVFTRCSEDAAQDCSRPEVGESTVQDALVAGARLNVGGGVFKLHELMSHCKYPQAAEAAHARDDTDLSSKAVLSTRLLQTVMPRDFSFVPPLESAAAAAARRAALAPDAVGPSPAASPAADSA